MREGQLGFLKPQTTGAVTASCSGAAAAFCFTGTSDSSAITGGYGTSPSLGITPGLPAANQGVPFIGISGGASLGNNWEGVLPQVGNSFQWSDSLTWVKGNHTFKFGIDARRARFDQTYYFDVNGEYTFNNSGPNAIVPNDGDNYAEYLLGLADTYVQGSAQREDVRSTSHLSVCPGQLEDQAEPDSELRSALGARYSSHRHQRARRDLSAGTKQHRVPLRLGRSGRLYDRTRGPRRQGCSGGPDFNLLQSFRASHRTGLESGLLGQDQHSWRLGHVLQSNRGAGHGAVRRRTTFRWKFFVLQRFLQYSVCRTEWHAKIRTLSVVLSPPSRDKRSTCRCFVPFFSMENSSRI